MRIGHWVRVNLSGASNAMGRNGEFHPVGNTFQNKTADDFCLECFHYFQMSPISLTRTLPWDVARLAHSSQGFLE